MCIAVDTAGAMMSQYDNARNIARAKLAALKPPQVFSLFIYQPNQPLELSSKLLPATAENIKKGVDLLDYAGPRGTFVMADFLKASFKQNPEEVWLLCDYTREPDKGVEIKIPAGVKVNVIVFPGDSASKYLLHLAKSTGGVCVSPEGEEVTKVYAPPTGKD